MPDEQPPETTATSTFNAGPDDFADFEKWRQSAEQGTPEPATPPAAPAEPVKADQEAAAPGETQESEEGEEEEAPKRKGGWQRKIDKLTAQNRELQEQLASTAAARSEQPQEPAFDPSVRPTRPKPGSYESWEAYEEAADKYSEALATHLFYKQLRGEQAQIQERQAQHQQAQIQAQWVERVKATKAAHADFDKVIDAVEVPLTPNLETALKASETGAEMAYRLSRNPEELQRIQQLLPFDMVKELGKLEAQIAAESQAAATPETPKRTARAAPEPIVPLGGSGKTRGVDIMDPSLDYREWEKERNRRVNA